MKIDSTSRPGEDLLSALPEPDCTATSGESVYSVDAVIAAVLAERE